MRARLEQAASVSGRSLGQEVEFRVGRDFNYWEASKEGIDKNLGCAQPPASKRSEMPGFRLSVRPTAA